MSNKNSGLEGFDYPDLDLSDEESDKKDGIPSGEPTKKTKLDQSISQTNQVQNLKPSDRTPVPFKPPGLFFPPPPPGSSSSRPATSWIPPVPINPRSNYQQQNSNSQGYNNQQNFQRPQQNQYQNNNRNQYQQQQKYDNREKKSIVYVKNIPKSYLTQDKLMTFFKNQGTIKQIKVNQGEQSAVIKFVKEENAVKFLKSNKIIFNRSYIPLVNNKFKTEQMINLVMLKKHNKRIQKFLKKAQNIRALYFLQNAIDEQKLSKQESILIKQELKAEINRKVQEKKMLEAQNLDDFKMQDYNTNFYNWCLIFVRKSNSGVDRKALFAQFLKYGPIVSLDHECISEKPALPQGGGGEDVPKHFLDYRFKLLFLGIKNAWNMYNTKKHEMGLTVQGMHIERYFESGKLKTVQPKTKRQTETIQGPQAMKIQEKIDNQPIPMCESHNQHQLKEVQEVKEEGSQQQDA